MDDGERQRPADEENNISGSGDRWDVPSPSNTTAHSFDALSISSTTGTSNYATPRSTLSTLPTPIAADYSGKWDYAYGNGHGRAHASGRLSPPSHSRSQSGHSSSRGEVSDVEDEVDELEDEGDTDDIRTTEGVNRPVSSRPGVSNLRGTPHGSGSSAGGSPSSGSNMDVDG